MATRTLDVPTIRFDRRKYNPWHITVFIAVTVLVAVPLTILILGSFSIEKNADGIFLGDADLR